MRQVVGAIALGFALGGCSTVMEYNRPEPVDLSRFKPGQHRIDVVKVLGSPIATAVDGAKNCDVYHLYTGGPGGAGKAGIIFLEGAADVVTLGLAEVISTPAEAATKSGLHPVTMCYDQNNALLSIEESPDVVNPGAAPVAQPMAVEPTRDASSARAVGSDGGSK